MRIEYANGRRVDVTDELVAIATLKAICPDAVCGDWEQVNDGRRRMLVWADDETAGPEGCGDDGSHAVAEIVDDCPVIP